MDKFLKEFGRKIKTYREKLGYSQEKLGELVEVSTKTIVFWENGTTFIKYPAMVRLCKVLGVEQIDLFNFGVPKADRGSSVEQIVNLSKKLSPETQEQIVEIIKTFK
jgi:DNA-binding XRE family transcriptional regulator